MKAQLKGKKNNMYYYKGDFSMNEEQQLRSAPGCGTFIMLGLIAIVLLSLVGIIFPVEILPYPRSVLIVIMAVSVVALVIAFLMRHAHKRDMQKEADDRADKLLRQGFDTMGDMDSEAYKLAKKYTDEE